jgi:hypothetical protein
LLSLRRDLEHYGNEGRQAGGREQAWVSHGRVLSLGRGQAVPAQLSSELWRALFRIRQTQGPTQGPRPPPGPVYFLSCPLASLLVWDSAKIRALRLLGFLFPPL